jgi:hypothetical protein
LNRHLAELDNDQPLLNLLDDDPTNPSNKIKTIVKGIHTRYNGDYLLDFDTPDSAERFLSYTSTHIFLLSLYFGISAIIKPRNYPLIMKFVPCTGEFNPKDDKHIADIEASSNLKKGAIVSANWIKRPDRRSPNQQVATLKVNCADPQSANHLLCEKVAIQGHIVTVLKDIHEPIRCNNCQAYGHIRANCKSEEICAHCCSTEHKTANCPPNQTPHCRACGPKSTHPSYSRKCPDFANRCASLDEKYPENNMPYFPTGEDWTWTMSPPKLSSVASRPRPHPHNRPPPPTTKQANLDQFVKPTKPKAHSSLPDRPSQPQPQPSNND